MSKYFEGEHFTRIELHRRQVSGYFEGEHFDSYQALQTPSVRIFDSCPNILRVSILTCIELTDAKCWDTLRVSILTRIELYRHQVSGYFEGEHFDSYRAVQTPSVGIL